MLLEEFLIPMSITQKELANAIHVPYQRVNEIINKRRGITPSTALRLAKFFGVSEDFWMNLQLRWDLYKTKRNEARNNNTFSIAQKDCLFINTAIQNQHIKTMFRDKSQNI